MSDFDSIHDRVQRNGKTRSEYIKGIVDFVDDMDKTDVSVSSLGEYKRINRSGLEKLFKHVLDGRGGR